MKFIDIQQDVITKYRIKIEQNSTCKQRMHAHVKERKICKWVPKNSVAATFDLLHQVGHIQTKKSWMRRCESEFYATQWAADEIKKYGIQVPEKTRVLYQNYINQEIQRGLIRGGQGYPENLNVKW